MPELAVLYEIPLLRPLWLLLLPAAVLLYLVLYNVMANFIAPNYYSVGHNMRTEYQAFKSSFGVH